MKIDRLIAIVMMMLEQDVISAGALAEKLEVSRRTIYRDIDALTMAGLPIYTAQGVAGGVGLMKSYKIDKRLFTPKDVQTLAVGLEGYRQLFGRSHTTHVTEKLRGIGAIDRPEREGAFAVDLTLPEGNRQLRSLFGVIEAAINGSRYLAFEYIDKDGKTSSRRVEAYLVVFKERSWYLQAYCLDRGDYRIFKLARMRGLRLLAETFAPRRFEPLPMDGAFMNRATVEVTVRLTLSVMDRVVERFGEQNIVAVEKDSCVAVYPIVDEEAGYDTLLRFGAKCEVLAPPEVRARFAAYVHTILGKYESEYS
ncbi:MAG: YafY family transcriptional regulator [Paenibacillaceae bacterium]|nr:YafY family transcriptional regulator [Paenibacillaceae bacterium]